MTIEQMLDQMNSAAAKAAVSKPKHKHHKASKKH